MGALRLAGPWIGGTAGGSEGRPVLRLARRRRVPLVGEVCVEPLTGIRRDGGGPGAQEPGIPVRQTAAGRARSEPEATGGEKQMEPPAPWGERARPAGCPRRLGEEAREGKAPEDAERSGGGARKVFEVRREASRARVGGAGHHRRHERRRGPSVVGESLGGGHQIKRSERSRSTKRKT